MKNKKTLSSFMAAVIAVCMMLQLTPALGNIPAAQAAVGDTHTINFVSRLVDGDYTDITEATLEEDGWEYDYENTTAGVKLETGLFLGTFTAKDQTVAFKIEVPENGTYSIDMIHNYYWYNTQTTMIIDEKEICTVDFDERGDLSFGGNGDIEKKDIASVDLKKGIHTLIFKCSKYTSGSDYTMRLCSMTFTKTADLITGPVIEFSQFTSADTGETVKNKLMTDSSPWAYDANKSNEKSFTLNYNISATDENGNSVKVNLIIPMWNTVDSDSQTTCFKIKVDEDGVYNLSTRVYLADTYHADGAVKFFVDGKQINETGISSRPTGTETATTLKVYNLGNVELKKGYHTLSLKQGKLWTGDYHGGYFESITFNKVGELTTAPEAVSDNFGANYAYVRESYVDGTTAYNVTFLGGIKKIEGYTQVGFQYSTDNGVTWTDTLDNKVYDKLLFTGDNTQMSNTEFGTDFIFYREVAFQGAKATDAVTFRAYALNEDGGAEYGKEFTVPVNK